MFVNSITMIVSLEKLKIDAQAAGFNFAGVIPAQPAPTLDAYFRWIDAGMHGSMGYLARPDRQVRRRDLNVILPGVRSLILVGLDYRTVDFPELSDPSRGRITSYAWGIDYHDILTPRLEQFARQLSHHTYRVYVDTGAILERAHAQQAGMGFIGKNTMLIHPRRGSYFFLGEILTDLEFDEYDQPSRMTMCGSCTRCLTACPTNAFPQPYVLDARRCISYLTIEHKGWIDRDLRPLMGNWVYGCDVCQSVCPWQRFSLPTQETAFYPTSIDRVAPLLTDLLQLDDTTFMARYAGSPIERIKRWRLVRNACVAAGNWGDESTLPILKTLLNDPHPQIRGHAAWAIAQVMDAPHDLLQAHYSRETDDDVKKEISLLL